jgi:hypothetical protein
MKAHFYRILRGGPETGMIVSALRTEIAAASGSRPGDNEMRDLVTDARDRGFITCGVCGITGDQKVSLTAKGRKQTAHL